MSSYTLSVSIEILIFSKLSLLLVSSTRPLNIGPIYFTHSKVSNYLAKVWCLADAFAKLNTIIVCKHATFLYLTLLHHNGHILGPPLDEIPDAK